MDEKELIFDNHIFKNEYKHIPLKSHKLLQKVNDIIAKKDIAIHERPHLFHYFLLIYQYLGLLNFYVKVKMQIN